jgi:hypothetical protein
MSSSRPHSLLLFVLVALPSAQCAILAQSIQVRVLDAKSGARVPNEKVSVFIKGKKGAGEYTTDSDGDFNLQIDPTALVYVTTEWRFTCRHLTPGVVPFVPVATVLQDGFTDENTCGRAKSETVKGKLIVFARKSSFFENLKR